ncbi:sodium:solute symporter [Luteolibacter arcticus]|uniref:Sodium:solute symporter n=1 Tax=Luteolibacter arcticus TaxID=1581411 RepID=A0ABT3GIT8_9BACT|nr:sodium:solute symporter [Luteolibacter arcticus]MCW1923409.1 sodium:solute symporter [Luteolibacter arcticus]
MTSHFTALDWTVLLAYFAATLGVGLFLSRGSGSAEGFTAANRSLPGWVCGLSIFATFLSSISFLALPGKSFGSDWTPFAFSLSIPLATWIAARWFLPFYRASGEVSAYAHLEHRFGPWARVYASSFYLLTQVARIAMVMYLMALPLAVIMGVPIGSVLVITGMVVTLYSLVGGIVAVIWTDALQAFVLIGGALACLALMIFQLPGGLGELFRVAGEHQKFSMGSMALDDWSRQTFWVVLLNGLFVNLQNFGIDQSYVQRYIASSSEKEARKSVWLGGMLYLPVSAVFFLIGTALFAFYLSRPGDLAEVRDAVASQRLITDGFDPAAPGFASAVATKAATLPDADIGDGVFPHFIGKHLPSGVTGLLIAAVFAAGMSTISTSLNSAATVFHADFFLRFFRPDTGDRGSLRVLRWATLVFGVVGTSVSFLLLNIASALDAWWTLSSIFSGGILGLFLLGLVSRRASNPAAIAAVICGLGIITWITLSTAGLWPESMSATRAPFHAFLAIVLGTLVILFGGVAFSTLFHRKQIRS